jgi:WD40 repeat protein
LTSGVLIWNAGTIIPSVTRASFPIKSSAMNTDGTRLVVGGFDGRVTVYEVGRENAVKGLHELHEQVDIITSVTTDKTGRKVFFASDSGAITLWDTDSGTTKSLIHLPASKPLVAVSSDGRTLATASSIDQREVYNRVCGTKCSVLQDSNRISSIDFNYAGDRLVGASEAPRGNKRLAFVWDAETGKTTLYLEHDASVLSAHFSQDGSRIATSSSDHKAHVWDASSGKELKVFNGHTYDVNSARLSPDGERIVTASSDRTVRVWDVTTGTPMLEFEIGSDANDAFFTHDGSHVMAVTGEGEILTYDVTWTANLDKDLKSRVCRNKLSGLDTGQLCLRIGPLSIGHWSQLMRKVLRWFS